jgi:glycosyltransferase involved in cell wall biosynthesis
MTRDLVVFSLESWDDIWRRNQYLVDGLLHRDPELRVLFVEPANDILHSILARRRFAPGRGLRKADGYDGRLLLYQPDKVLPRAFGGLADRLLRRSVRHAMRRVGMSRSVLWVNDPGWAAFAAEADEPSLYDMTDDWTVADRSPREHLRVVANDRVLTEHCDVVVVCSRGLEASRSQSRPVTLIPNAVDVSRYRLPQHRPTDLPPHSALYVGTLHEDRLDVDLILQTADAIAPLGGSVVLAGPNALARALGDRLRSHPAVVFLGSRHRDEVPAYLQHADVLIVPHVVSTFTDSLDPIKLYEYTATDRRIVSTPVAGFRDADDDGVIVATDGEFADRVASALSEPADPVIREGVPDWSERVEAMATVVDRLRDVDERTEPTGERDTLR